MNQFVTEKVSTPPILRVDPAVEQSRISDLAKLRASRDQGAVDAVLAKIRTASGGSENMMPLLIEAAELYVTVGEMCKVLREEWGEYHEVMTL